MTCELVSCTPQSVPEAAQLECTELDVLLSSKKNPSIQVQSDFYTKLTAFSSASVPQNTQIIWNRWTTIMPKTGHTVTHTCSNDLLAPARTCLTDLLAPAHTCSTNLLIPACTCSTDLLAPARTCSTDLLALPRLTCSHLLALP